MKTSALAEWSPIFVRRRTMGKGGSPEVDVPTNPYEEQIAKMAQELWTGTNPMRNALFSQLNRFMGVPTSSPASTGGVTGTAQTGGTPSLWTNALTGETSSIAPQDIMKNMYKNNPYSLIDYGTNVPGGREAFMNAWQPVGGIPAAMTNTTVDTSGYGDIPSLLSPVMQAGKRRIESQYKVALDNLMANSPAGGALISSLSDLEQGRAGALGDLEANVAQDLYNKVYGLASNTPQTSMSGLSSAASSYGGMYNSGLANQAQANQMNYQGMYGLGQLLGGGGGNSLFSKAGSGLISLLGGGGAAGWGEALGGYAGMESGIGSALAALGGGGAAEAMAPELMALMMV